MTSRIRHESETGMESDSVENLNLLYNKLYYSGLRFSGGDLSSGFDNHLTEINKRILGAVFSHDRDYRRLSFPTQHFCLKTTYPGLIAGTGYTHETGLSDEEAKIGFTFDYVTGQPYLPGSSIKGVLRSHFQNRAEAVLEIVNDILDKEAVYFTEPAQIRRLEKMIFEEGGDVFFDAVVFSADDEGKLMARDTITPHPSPTKDPRPVQFIKVCPEVRFEFRFLLKDSFVDEPLGLTADKKQELFEALLVIFGAGAKTNVGYGFFVRADENNPFSEDRSSQGNRQPKEGGGQGHRPGGEQGGGVSPSDHSAALAGRSVNEIPVGTEVDGKIAKNPRRDGNGRFIRAEISVKGYEDTLTLMKANADEMRRDGYGINTEFINLEVIPNPNSDANPKMLSETSETVCITPETKT